MQFKSIEFIKELALDLSMEFDVNLTNAKLIIKTSIRNGLVINQGKLVINKEVLEASVMVDVNTGAFHHIDTIQCQLHLDSEAENPEKTKQSKLLIAMLCKMYCLPYDYTIKF